MSELEWGFSGDRTAWGGPALLRPPVHLPNRRPSSLSSSRHRPCPLLLATSAQGLPRKTCSPLEAISGAFGHPSSHPTKAPRVSRRNPFFSRHEPSSLRNCGGHPHTSLGPENALALQARLALAPSEALGTARGLVPALSQPVLAVRARRPVGSLELQLLWGAPSASPAQPRSEGAAHGFPLLQD